MSEHVLKALPERQGFAITCPCGLSLYAAGDGYEVRSLELRSAGDPRKTCPGVVRLIAEKLGIEGWRASWPFEQAEMAGRFKIAAIPAPPVAVAPTDALVTATPAVCEKGERSERAERVSRPPQSASSPSKPSSLQGREVASDGECSSASLPSAASNGVDKWGPRHVTGGPLLLANQVDTLYVTWWHVRLDPAVVERLKASLAKVQAATGDGPDSAVEFGDEKWILEPKTGRRAQFVMKNDRARLDVWIHGGKVAPTLTFYFDPHVTWSLGAKGTLEWAEAFALGVHTPETKEERDARSAGNGGDQDDETPEPCMKIRRTDQAADFLNMGFENAAVEEFVVRPRRRGRYFTVEKNDLDACEFWSGLIHTGNSFGKGDLMLRVYNKTKEIEDQSPEKRWLYGFWKKCYACGCRENEHEPVTDQKPEIVGYARCAREGCECLGFVIDESGFMDKRPCDACGETGRAERLVICPECRGRGTKGRKKAKRMCLECQGEKKVRRKTVPVRHKECRGKGCDKCERTGRVQRALRCKACKGKKTTTDVVWRVEPQLQRSTLTEFAKGVARTCPTCSGQGKKIFTRACRACDGKGKRPCRSCAGTGARPRGPCSACDGKGARECFRCKGAGRFEKNKLCKRCEEKGVRLERPKPEELADPVEHPELVIATDACGAKNVGESLAIDLDSKEGYLRSLKAIWRYCVGGGQGIRGWATWRTPTDNPQRTRWPLKDEWRAVQAVEWGEDAKDELVRVKRVKATFERGIVQLAGFLTSAMADAIEIKTDDEAIFEKGCGMAWREVASLYERRERKSGEGVAAVIERKRTTRALWGVLGARARHQALVAKGIPSVLEDAVADAVS